MRDEIATALHHAVEGSNKRRLCTLRLMNAAIRDRDAALRDAGRERASDAEIAEILGKMIRHRECSAASLESNGGADEAVTLREEVALIRGFLPSCVTQGEMEDACRQAVLETGSKSLRDVGRCMNALKERYQDKLNMIEASTVVRGLLG